MREEAKNQIVSRLDDMDVVIMVSSAGEMTVAYEEVAVDLLLKLPFLVAVQLERLLSKDSPVVPAEDGKVDFER